MVITKPRTILILIELSKVAIYESSPGPTRPARVFYVLGEISPSRSARREILPDGVRGKSLMNSIRRGYLYGAISNFTKSWSSRASLSDANSFGRSTT